MIFVSFFTRDTPYAEVIEKYLLPSLKRWNLKYHIESIADFGNWMDNTGYKATCILNALEHFKEDICFLDADASIERYPELLFNLPDCDIACHMLDWCKFWRNKEGQDERELLSGTIVFKYKPAVLELSKEYVKQCAHLEVKEQEVLQKLIEERKLVIYDLPKEYTTIKRRDGYILPNAVIVHHQVSRLYRDRKAR